MFGVAAGDKLLGGYPLLAGADHDGGSVSIVGTYVNALVAAHLLKAHPEIRLDVFDQMPDVNIAVGVGKRTRYDYFPVVAHISSLTII
jgi:hypothetical protein